MPAIEEHAAAVHTNFRASGLRKISLLADWLLFLEKWRYAAYFVWKFAWEEHECDGECRDARKWWQQAKQDSFFCVQKIFLFCFARSGNTLMSSEVSTVKQ